MEYLYYVDNQNPVFFCENVVNGRNNAEILYNTAVSRKSDPLLIYFLNDFTESDFDRTGIPKTFTYFLTFIQNDEFLKAAWNRDHLTADEISWWLIRGEWHTRLSDNYQSDLGVFYSFGILETLLSPILQQRSPDAVQSKLISAIMNTDWTTIRISWKSGRIFPDNDYLRYLHIPLVQFSAFWHFINHQAVSKVDDSIGLFPEKKVRYFTRSYLGIHFDSMRTDPFMEGVKGSAGYNGPLFDPTAHYPDTMNTEYKWKRFYAQNSFQVLKNVQDPFGFCRGIDSEYAQFAEYGDVFQAQRLLEILCLSLLHFSIYQVPIRRCSLCGQFYIPIKNPLSELNYCYRTNLRRNGKSCSYFHSHNQRGPAVSASSPDSIKLEKSIGSFRSTLSQSSLSEQENGSKWLSQFRDCLSAIKQIAKSEPLQAHECFAVLDQARELYRQLKETEQCPIPLDKELNVRNSNLYSVKNFLSEMSNLLK